MEHGGGPSGFRTMSEEEMAEMFGGAGGDSPFSDFFNTFFGGMGGEEAQAGGGARARSSRARNRKGQDVEHPFELDLEDAIKGSVQRLQLRHDGHARTVEVRIPAGVTEGSRVRVAGEGGRGAGSAPSGDLYLRVQLKPHPVFDVKGRDVYTRSRVPVTTAVLGGEVDVVDARIKDAAVEAAAGHAERPAIPPARSRPADRWENPTSVGTSTRTSKWKSQRSFRKKNASTTKRSKGS